MICVCLFLNDGGFIIQHVGDGLQEYGSVREFCVFVFSLILVVVVAADDFRSRLSMPRWATTRMYSRH
jgi:hypothetical protein